MTVPGSANPLLLRSAAPTAYQVSRSLRFNSADSAYLSRTPGSAGNRKTWTWSGWVKRSGVGKRQFLLEAKQSGANTFLWVGFGTDDKLLVLSQEVLTLKDATTLAVFRDPSAWLHVVVSFDVTQSTASDRVKIYVNGIQQSTQAQYGSFTNQDYPINSTAVHDIGKLFDGATDYYSDGYLANVEFVDGSALTPSSFAETDATTGQWVPKLFSGSYGTNGFKLTFADNSNNTASTLGADTSGNGNNWTPNNLSVTAGAGNDSLTDTPTSYGSGTSGGDVRGNFCINNPLDTGSGITLANGTLDLSIPASSSVWWQSRGSIGVTSGKWYWEVTVTTNQYIIIGVARGNVSLNTFPGNTADGWGWAAYAATKYNNASGLSYGSATTSGDVVGVAYDADNSTLTFYKNGVSQGSAYTNVTTTSGPIFPSTSINSLAASSCVVNYGQRAFAYTPPANFKPLVDTYLPTPTVAKPSEVMDVKLYTGTGSSQTITGLSFNPDFLWFKSRGFARHHALIDQVRGGNKLLGSSITDAEGTYNDMVTAFNSNGFTLGADATTLRLNESGYAYVAWAWDAGTSTVTDTAGSITSSVRANASAGFSIVSWTSDGSTSIKTCGHGLGVKPSLIIFKNRDLADQWGVLHSSFADQTKNWMRLNTTDAVLSSGAFTYFSYDSTTFGIKQNEFFSNTHRGIAYCFAPVAGYSSFGSYTSNNSADGPFIYTGFKIRFLLVKQSGGSGNPWLIFDSARSTYNVVGNKLAPNSSVAEDDASIGNSTQNTVDFLSNGFKFRTANTGTNGPADTYIYCAWAESPFQYARAR